ncbi:MAG: murein biosynthesis integral membrane protein MurJ [Deltaproteobacteria bacterium]|nr:murein biosynthesis integral membrane protein MurJ [Deltaproteobacteria bacterium]MBW2175650.1 murein biosynthesis integral membrane protein MurJ [Deltaproteobacteria bacterium]MBW2614134.1 murein biosynthesis integral membrane protein MurJ [Deltaproteobacteria bacterium]MBW2678576.1 murein biosynthesis integral membrane protein MurJ [Deltaproteobacteria bacterium]
MTENAKVTRAAGIVGAATFLSRVFGFVRDVVIAGYFGAGLASDAFFVAFRIPNLLRRLFAEGSLTVAFIPVFSEYLTRHGREEAYRLARSAMRMLSIILAVAAVAGVLASPVIVHIIAPGFTASPEKYQLCVDLTRFMFPYIFFIGLVALCMGILNVLGHFAAPALAPVFLNLAMITSVLLFSPHLERPVFGLAVGVLLGGLLQLLLQIPFLIKNGLFFWQKTKIFHPGLKRIGKLMLPAVFGAAVYQINMVIGTLLASLLPEGSVSYLYYADRLVQFPLGIFAIATATAVLPSLSKQVAKEDFDGLRETFRHAMNFVFFITIPAMVGLVVLREPIVYLLFKRGAFDVETVRLTATALLYYCAGLWAFSAVRIVVSMFYALQDTKTPVKMAVVSITVNVLLGIGLMGPLKHGGLALATSLASVVNLLLLIWALRQKIGMLGWRQIMSSAAISSVNALLMGLVVWGTAGAIIPRDHHSTLVLLAGVAGSVGAGVVTYAFLGYLFGGSELGRLVRAFRRR